MENSKRNFGRAIAAGLLTLPLCAFAGGGPYKDLYEPLAKIRQADPDGLLHPTYQIKPKDALIVLSKVELKLVVDGKETPLPLDEDGNFELPMHAEWAAADAQFVTNQPKGTLQVAMNLELKQSIGAHAKYSELFKGVPVMNRAIKAQAGLMSFAAPSCVGVILVFDGTTPQTLSYQSDGKPVELRSQPDAAGKFSTLEIKQDEALLKADPDLSLSAAPKSMVPLLDK